MSKVDTVLLFHPKLTPKNSGQVHFSPLYVLSVAAPLLEEGINVEIIDSNFGDRFADKHIDLDKVICVGITAMTGYQIQDGIDFAMTIRRTHPNIKIVWGGVHGSLLPMRAQKASGSILLLSGRGR